MINQFSNPTSSPQSPLPPQPTITTLPSATTILSQAWSLYKQRLGTFLGVMIIPMLVLIGIVAIFFGIRLLVALKFLPGGIVLIFGLVSLLIIFLSQIWGQTALLYAIKDSQEGIGVREAYRRGWPKIISYWWVSLLVGFITMGGLFLFVVPGIIFTVWFSLAKFVLVAEDLKGMNALLKSREYVKGKWGSVFWRFFFIEALSFIVFFLVSFIFGLIPYGKYLSRLVIALFLTPLMMIYGFLVYSHLKTSKGEVAFFPTQSQKVKFILLGLFGILVIPILFSIVLHSLNLAKKKTRDTLRQVHLRQIQIGLEMYYAQYGKYPFSLKELSPEYLPTIPVDPKTKLPYQYQRLNEKNYQLCAQLEARKQKSCLSSSF